MNTSSTSGKPSATPLAAEGTSTKPVNISAIVGGSVGGALAILIAVILWILYRHCHKKNQQRKFESSAWPTTFHADMMVKRQGVIPTLEKPLGLGIDGQSKVARRSVSRASSAYSSVDSTNEQYPALKGFQSRSGHAKSSGRYHDESEASDGDDDGDESGSSLVSSGYGRGLNRLSPPRTDRQMELEQKIHDLRAQMISLSHRGSQEGSPRLVESVESDDTELSVIRWHHIRAKIKQLEALEFSDWALGTTDQVPKEFLS
ncbi:hypothetical protein C8R42DRAFT_384271 [Lentinula raphanica]|nr:hypothetical protein C8R42DRAFT_384271 [Lentinula raphanica]